MSNAKQVASNIDMRLNTVDRLVLEGHDEMPVASKSKEGEITFDSTKKLPMFFANGVWNQFGVTGALVPMGTVGTGGDREALPTANVDEGHSWFVVADGKYEKREAHIGDFFFAKKKSSWADILAYGKDDTDEDLLVFIKDGEGTESSGGIYFDDDTAKILTKDCEDYVAPDTGAKFILKDLDSDGKYWLTYVDDAGAESKAVRHGTTGKDVANIYPAWALVPAGNGYFVYEIAGEGVSGKDIFEFDNFFHTTKCSVTLKAHENTEEGFELAEGEEVIATNIITASKITIKFGNPLFADGEGPDGSDHSTYQLQIKYC